MLLKKGELKLLWPFYLVYLIHGLSCLILPFFIIYFKSLGFSFFQLALLTSGFAIGAFLFEIPTGAFADSMSRKISVIVGYLIIGISMILIPVFDEFHILLVLWIIAGLGMTFISGAEEAWVIDNLNHSKRSDLHHEFFVKAQSMSGFGLIISPLIAAILVKNNPLSLLWIIFGSCFIANALVLTLFGRELYESKQITLMNALKETFVKSKSGFKFSFRHKTVLLLITGGMFAGLMMFGDNGWQPFLVQLSMPTPGLGILYSIGGAVIMVSSFLSRALLRFKVKNTVSVILLIRMIFIFSLLFIHSPFFMLAGIIFLLDLLFSSLKDPLLQTYFHKFVPDNIRATVVSTGSMMSKAILALGGLAAGALQDVFGPQTILAMGGLFGVFAIASYVLIKD